MKHSVAHARNNLPTLIHEVERGDPVEITRHGQPVAVLLSLPEYRRLAGAPDAQEQTYAEFCACHRLVELDFH